MSGGCITKGSQEWTVFLSTEDIWFCYVLIVFLKQYNYIGRFRKISWQKSVPRICWYQGFHLTRALSDTLGAQPESSTSIHRITNRSATYRDQESPDLVTLPGWILLRKDYQIRVLIIVDRFILKKTVLAPLFYLFTEEKKRSGVISSSKSHGSLQSGYLQDYSKHTYIDVYIYTILQWYI